MEFETGKETENPNDVGVTFKYISAYFSGNHRKDSSKEGKRYSSNNLRYKKDPNGPLNAFKTVTILGASGAMATEIIKRMLTERPLGLFEKIQLFGRPKESFQGKEKNFYHAFIEKLRDGMAGILPIVDFIDSYDAVDGELLIMCVGKTISKEKGMLFDRSILKHENRSIFENCARSIYENSFKSPDLVIVVSNPNELCTSIFSRYFKRVVAIGPVMDSLRLQREIREELNVPVEISIDALVGGVHELTGMVPYKSMLRIDGRRPNTQLLHRIFNSTIEAFDIRNVYEKAFEMVQNGDEGVFDFINTHSILTRMAVKPLIEYYCGGKADFPMGIAVINTIKALQDASRTLMTLTKRTLIKGADVCIGIPLFVSTNGLEEIELCSVKNFQEDQDDEQLTKSADALRQQYGILPLKKQ
ncbi:MAG: hypothetical protein SVY10_10055 [Thermodesulfobacteriota bacterium]|nr:hypothetical protein [Thermodesulfobacteriota bacterium]